MISRFKLTYAKGLVAVLFLLCPGWLSASVALGGEIQFPIRMTQNAPMPTPDYGHALAAVDGKIYAIGGWQGGDIVQIYDTATDTWSSGAAKPTPAANINAAVIDGKIYVPGGYDPESLEIRDSLEIYDPATDQWNSGASLPMPLTGCALAAVDGKLYLMGGQSDGSDHVDAYVYDPAADTWSGIAPMQNYRSYAAAAVLDGKIYVSGGWHDGAYDATEFYDPATDVWTSVGDLPVPRAYHSSASGLGKLMVFGGQDPSEEYMDSIELYDSSSKSWIDVNLSLSQPAVLVQAVTVGNRIYIIGGLGFGDYATDANDSFVIPDTDAPVVNTATVPEIYNELTVPVASFVATDDVAVTGYMVTGTSDAPLADSGQWSNVAPISHTSDTAGAKTLYFWAKDAAGNVSTARTANVNIDLTAPTATLSVAGAANTLTVPLSISAVDGVGGTGVDGYMITLTPSAPSPSSPDWSTSAPTEYTFASAGLKTLYVWAKDAAGNVSAEKGATVNVDTTAPTVNATVASSVKILNVPVTFSAADGTGGSGVAGYMITLTSTKPEAASIGWSGAAPKSYTVAGAGVRTLYFWAKDAAGNVSTGKSVTVNVDLTAPTTTFSVKAAVNTLKVPVTAGSTDVTGGSGIAGYMITIAPTAPLATTTGWVSTVPTSYTSATAGLKTLYLWAKDAAGNVSAARSAKVNIDLTAPVVTFTAPGAVNTLKVPVKVSAADAAGGSGVTGYIVGTTSTAPLASSTAWSATVPASYTSTSAGAKTLYVWAKDAAGNVSVVKSAKVNIDLTPPVVTFTAPGAVNTLKVPVKVSAADATGGSGVTGYIVGTTSTKPLASSTAWSATAPTSYTFTSKGSKTLYGWAKDAAGNVSAAKVVTLVIN